MRGTKIWIAAVTWGVVAVVAAPGSALADEVPASAPASAPSPAPESIAEELWAGHQLVTGSRPLPVFGDIETRGESFVLARARITSDRIELEQWPCVFRFKPVLGVSVRMSAATMKKLPRARIRFLATGDQAYRAPAWEVGWDRQDLDGDGHPGVTVQVDNAFCDGEVYTASRSTSTALARRLADGLEGDVTVRTRERVHDASRLCLKAGSSEREEVQQGRFRYRRVAPGTRCEDLQIEAWPVRVDVEAQQK
ncbi:MAG: hypothetical protein ABIJ09_00975 [Pseudomonadota bacterium]